MASEFFFNVYENRSAGRKQYQGARRATREDAETVASNTWNKVLYRVRVICKVEQPTESRRKPKNVYGYLKR